MTLAQLQAEYRALGKTGPSEQTMAQYEWTAWAKAKTCNTAIAAYNWTLGWVVRPLAYVEPGEYWIASHSFASLVHLKSGFCPWLTF